MNKVSILIINYNHGHYIEKCLDSLKESIYPIDEVVLVDNNSNDDSLTIVEREYPYVRVIKNVENYGFSKGFNIGLKSIRNRYVCLIGPDVVVEPNWLSPLMEAIKSDDKIIFCASKVLHMDKKNIISSAGSSIHYTGHMVLRGRFEKDQGKEEEGFQEVNIVDSTSMLLDLEKFKEIGLLDEDYFIYYDEMDFCLRAKIMRGYKCLYVPCSRVYHGEGTPTVSYSGKRGFPHRRVYFMTRNRIMVMLKHYQIRTFLLILPALFLFEIVTIMFMLKNGVIASYLNGIFWNMKHVKMILKKRKRIQRGRKIRDRYLLSAEPLTFHPDLYKNPFERYSQVLLDLILTNYWKMIKRFL